MPQLGGGTPRRTSLYTYFLQGFGILLLLYSVGIITWQHYHFVNIGVFDVKKRKARIARNPKNGAAVAVPEKNVPYFRMGKGMKDRLNK